ncbi:MAG TPA: hypothetical protein VIF63_05050 [Candidatus Limnocylindrales bacterium]
MTSESAVVGTVADPSSETDDDGRMFCYRHPDRETWLRCGRCDQPICTKCSVQGPVGSRCRQCGTVRNDPLTSFTPRQLALAIGVSLVAGAVGGYIAGSIGFFSIVVGYFAGRITAEAVTRVVGFKRGPVMLSIVFGGIIVGAALGAVFQFSSYYGYLPEGYEVPIQVWLQSFLPGVLISAGAACFGAYQSLH